MNGFILKKMRKIENEKMRKLEKFKKKLNKIPKCCGFRNQGGKKG